jgi:hypothetical protein
MGAANVPAQTNGKAVAARRWQVFEQTGVTFRTVRKAI